MSIIPSRPAAAALAGSLFALPFLALNALVASRVEPFLAWLRPDSHTGAFELAVLAFSVLLLPAGALVVARPMLTGGAARKFHLLNALIATGLLAGFVLLAGTLGAESYRCDVLQIPNCD